MAEEKKDEQAKPATPAAAAEGAPKAAPAKPALPAPTPWQSDLVNSLRAAFPDVSFEAFTYLNQNFLILPLESILPVAMFLKSDSGFDMLTDLTAVDYPKREKRFEVIYELYSFSRNERLRLKVPAADGEIVESMVSVWGVADWLERECFDMFGIRFAHHPNLRRILLPDEWEGYPLRKDYPILKQDEKWVRENLHIESGQ
jgi:NADH-quinone oxidoreductase subunit C